MFAWAFIQLISGTLPDVESASLEIAPDQGWDQPLTTLGLLFLLARAFSSGCAALTGVEAISNGVPAFQRPKSKNAATTLLLLGMIAITMMVSVIVLAKQMGIKYVDPDDLDKLTRNGEALPGNYDQHTVIAQIARAVFPDFSPGFYFVVTVTGVILVLAANTAFNGFPVLGSILAKDGYAPRALGSRGDRLAYSNGIVFLAVMAIALIVAFDAETTKLIQLYIVGVFVSFNLSQIGMIRHWTRALATERNPALRRRMFRSRIINAIGLTFTAVVLVVVLITKFMHGAWITILAMAFFFVIMRAIKSHYNSVELELAADETDNALPTRVHAIVLVSKLHKPTLRALAFAKASRPNSLEGVYVSIDNADTARLLEEWDQRITGVPLKVLHSPYREVVKPIVEYAIAIRGANPRVGRRRLHPGVRRRAAGGSSCSTTRPRCGSRAGCSSRRASWSRRCPTSSGPRRSRASARSARRPGSSARAGARARTGRSSEPAAPPAGPAAAWPVPRRRAVRGRGGAGRARRALRRTPLRCAEGDRVVFVRHALPGERVVVEITEGTEGDRFWRGDAVEVLEASADRVAAPCPYAGPGLCGGCDFQHVSLAAQRGLKAEVVREQLRRLARLDVDVVVEPVPGDRDGLGWRTRQRYVPLPGGRRACASTGRTT